MGNPPYAPHAGPATGAPDGRADSKKAATPYRKSALPLSRSTAVITIVAPTTR